jgi:hypothetical protein
MENEQIRPGTPQANCSLCQNFDAQSSMCKKLGIQTTPMMVSDFFTPMGTENQLGLEEMLFTGAPVNG